MVRQGDRMGSGKQGRNRLRGRHVPTECSRHPRAGSSDSVPLRTEQGHRRKRRRGHQHSQLRGCPAGKRVRNSRIAVGCRRRRAEWQERQPSCPDRHRHSCRNRRNHAALVREDRSKVKPNTPDGMKKEQSMTAPFSLSRKPSKMNCTLFVRQYDILSNRWGCSSNV